MDLSQATGIYLGSTGVSAVYYGSTKIWPSTHDYSLDYFTIESTTNNNNIYFGLEQLDSQYSVISRTISVSTDNGTTWSTFTPQNNNRTLIATLNSGDKIIVKGTNSGYAGVDFDGHHYFSSDDNVIVSGNIMSLLYGDNYQNQTTISADSGAGNYTFGYLFSTRNDVTRKWLKIYNTENLILPATIIQKGVYLGLFYNQTLITKSPVIPDIDFSGGGGTIITTVNAWCNSMFYGCSSLNYITCLISSGINQNSLGGDRWVEGVAANGTFVKNTNATNWDTATPSNYYMGIPQNWTIENV